MAGETRYPTREAWSALASRPWSLDFRLCRLDFALDRPPIPPTVAPPYKSGRFGRSVTTQENPFLLEGFVSTAPDHAKETQQTLSRRRRKGGREKSLSAR